MTTSTATDNPLLSLLLQMHERQASDLHLVPGNPPTYRIHGDLIVADPRPLPAESIQAFLNDHSPQPIQTRLAEQTDVDFALQLDAPHRPRFRVNGFRARGEWGLCFRSVPDRIPELADIGLDPELARRVTDLRGGLVLVTGVTGSGKTTTLACLINRIHQQGGCRIITIEEPIEYIYQPVENSLVSQREVGGDVPNFYEGLRSALRQDPDVILVGEIRDRETASLAVSAAETGHLIFATLHASDAKGAITRLIDIFPAAVRDDVRTQLSMSLRFVIAQHLLPPASGQRRVLAAEILASNFAIANAIRTGKIESLDSNIQSGRRDGSLSLDADLHRLVAARKITPETAVAFAKDPDEFK